MKDPESKLVTLDAVAKDLPMRRSARLRERAESLVLLGGIMAFWAFVYALNFAVGQASTPMLR
ncbi:MAG: hypothetical protein ABR508_06010 [Candidatus Baltobacteraceae bacterium]